MKAAKKTKKTLLERTIAVFKPEPPVEAIAEILSAAGISPQHAGHVEIIRDTNLKHEGVFSVRPPEAQTRETF